MKLGDIWHLLNLIFKLLHYIISWKQKEIEKPRKWHEQLSESLRSTLFVSHGKVELRFLLSVSQKTFHSFWKNLDTYSLPFHTRNAVKKLLVPTIVWFHCVFLASASLDRNDNFVREYNLTKLSSSSPHDVMIVPHQLTLLLKQQKRSWDSTECVCFFRALATSISVPRSLAPFNACKTQQQISYLNLLTIYEKRNGNNVP